MPDVTITDRCWPRPPVVEWDAGFARMPNDSQLELQGRFGRPLSMPVTCPWRSRIGKLSWTEGGRTPASVRRAR